MMDKFQQYIFRDETLALFVTFVSSGKTKSNVSFENDEATLEQDLNYHLDDYSIAIRHSSVERAESFKDGKWSSFEKDATLTIRVPVSFNNGPTKIRLIFVNNIADPYEFSLNYVYSDKLKFDAIEMETNRKNDIAKVAMRVTSGDSLINVSFQPFDNTYSSAIVELYRGGLGSTSLMGRFSVPQGPLFCAIKDLAYGRYHVKLFQYRKDKSVLFESDYAEIDLNAPGDRRGIGPRW